MSIKCTFTPTKFKQEVLKKVLPIFKNRLNMSDKDVRDSLYNTFKDISEQLGITGINKVDESLEIIKKEVAKFFKSEQWLDDNDIRAALTQWKHTPVPEDNTADHLLKDNEKLERVNEDPFETYYQFAMNAKIRAKQQANKVGIRSILYNEQGIINSTNTLNESVRSRQEELLKDVIDYLKSRIPEERQNEHPEIFSEGRMYIDNKYTGIVEKIQEYYGSILGSQNFDPRILNKYYNDENYKVLDAYNSWIILNHFDTILQQIFGKAISINPDLSKYSAKNKYAIAGGSNVYATWRTSEEIDMGKEINNITQAIVTSIPFIPYGSTTPSQNNIKFNEFLYIISKIKNLIQTADNDWTITFGTNTIFSEDFVEKYNGKSFLGLISSIRTNPQEILPDIFKLLNNDNVISALISANVIESNTFLNVDKSLINSLYEGLFNEDNPNSLLSIQNKSGFDNINYFAFVAQTIDSAFQSSYLQYFRNQQGEIFIRNMYDQSISNIEYAIKDTINSINSKLLEQTYDESKYDVKTENRTFSEGQTYNIHYNGLNYTLTQQNSQITAISENGKVIYDSILLENLIKTFLNTPNNIIFTIKNFHKGPLKVIVSLNKDSVTYEVNGQQFESFTSKKDFDSLQDFIQEILHQNLNIDNAYLDAYKSKFKYGAEAGITSELMKVASRVLANKHLSNTILKDLNPSQINHKLNQIFGKEKSSIKPTVNKQLGEINVITDSATKTISNLAEAKAQATGRLTSSQVIDSNGNAVASSSLSRLLSTYTYQINEQVLTEGAAAQGFSLWNTGVFKGIRQMKEIQDNSEDSSKSSTEFSNSEMEYGTMFVDFMQSLLTKPVNDKTPLQKGLCSFIPSENSDKTYIGRMLIDLAKLKFGEESVYDILRKNPTRIAEVVPTLAKELDAFYTKALNNINSTWARVGLLVGERVSYGDWGHITVKALKEGKSTLQYINDIVTKYNNENPTNPIVLIDQVHYVSDKNGELQVNESFLENTKRFKNPISTGEFLHEQNIETVKQLLKDKLRVPMTPEIQAKMNEWKEQGWEDASKWIDSRTGEIIFAKIHTYNPKTGEYEFVSDIRRPNDLSLLDDIHYSVDDIEINPIIESYNILNFFFTQEFMNSTVGAFYAHPNKKAQHIQQLLMLGKINEQQAKQMILEDEKARKLAQDKRNVSFTAAMHSFIKNLIQGIPDEINIAIMEDPKDYLSTISGDTFDITPLDGCTFECPFFGEQENASLGGAKVGVNKKTFTHFYDARTGTGGIIKTANFPLTNDRIRGSKFYQRMMRNMTDRVWKNQNGTDFIIKNGYYDYDETRQNRAFYEQKGSLLDYNGHPISFTNPNDINGELYFKDNGEYFKIASIEYLGNNTFQRYIQKVDGTGLVQGEVIADPQGPQVVNTNYKLWNLFGGAYSMELTEGSSKLEFTENSVKIVANIINRIGTDPKDKTGQTPISGIVRTQSDIYQPLKHSDIHLMPTVGAIKQGAGNINTVDKYDISDPSKINFMRVKMNQAGIQLDKEHHADDEDLSIMTQVISACAARGYTHEQQQQMLNALASLARAGIKDYIDSFGEFFTNPDGYVYEKNPDGTDKIDPQTGQKIPKTDINGNLISTDQNYQQVIIDTLIDALIHSTNSAATLQMVTQELINKAKEGREIAFKDANTIPYSDPSVFRKLHSTIAVALTRGAIKIKVQGVLSVLCPSFGVVKLYNNKTLNSFNNDEQIQAEQDDFDSIPENNLVNDIGRLKLGRTYKIIDDAGNVQLLNTRTQDSYYNLKGKLKTDQIDSSLVDTQFVEGMKTFNGVQIQYKEIGYAGGRKIGGKADIVNGTPVIYLDRQALSEKWNEKAWKNPLRSDFIGIVDFKSENDLITWTLLHELGHIKYDDKNHPDLDREFKENRANSYASQNFININPQYKIKSIIEQFAPMPELGFEGGRELGSYNATFQAIDNININYNVNDLASVHRLSNLKKQGASAEEIDQALKDVQWDLNILSNLKNPTIKEGENIIKDGSDKSLLLDDGTRIQVNPKSINIEPYEIVMPKIFASIFGLEVGDDLEAIKNDKDFFVKKLIQAIKPKVSSKFYSIGLMNIGNRNSLYILDRNQGVQDTDSFTQKEIQQINEKGKIWRVRNGEKMYQMQKGDAIYEYRHPDGTIQEVIVSNKPEFYIKNYSYTTLNCSDSYNKNTFIFKLQKNKKDNRAIKDYLDAIETAYEIYGDSYETAIENIQNIYNLSDLKESPVGDYFIKRGHEIHTSFLQSLKVVAARIPAQSMQSFMPMKVVAFEAPDINTAYVSTAQFLFQGSDLDIDAVSLASFSFDKSGRYILHSPYGNTETLENLEASMTIPFPTGKILEINSEKTFDYSRFISYAETDGMPQPFVTVKGTDKLITKLNNPYNIKNFAKLIEYFNRIGYIPASQDASLAPIVDKIKKIVNKHNNYINSDKAEDFSKNFVVATMYNIGISPANLIESQQALDYITKPLKDVANNTIKAKESSLENPANFTTNIHGIAQNMAGKKGVGICAVGLKSFFAATARYNEVLRNGTEWEQARLKSEVTIAGKKYQMLANAYGVEISNQAIAQVVSELSNQDQALILSALLSLATDNAKELALDKLNASNMLGMYIYGITIGMDFKAIADIICSETGLVINELMGSNSFLKEKGKNIQNIFDYLELAPVLDSKVRLSEQGNAILLKLDRQELFNLTHKGFTIEEQLEYLNNIKQEIDQNVLHDSDEQLQEYYELHRLVEQAENYIERYNSINQETYKDFKKLNDGAEEIRRLGQLLHINQGLENSYAKSINYLNIVTSVIADRQYSKFREYKRKKVREALEKGESIPFIQQSKTNWNFEFHQFVSDQNYKEAWIDLYEGKCNRERFQNSQIYRDQFAQVYPIIRQATSISDAYSKVMENIKKSKVFINILDVLQVPHFASYLESADMLHQAMMKTSIKYRSVFKLGQRAIDILGAYSTNDKESIYRRTEQMVDRIIRDRYYLSKGLEIVLPRNSSYFIKENGQFVKKSKTTTTPIQLGTEEGNASFKLFMETVVIPNLQKGKYGDGNNQDAALLKNEFIKSLAPTLYKHNAHYNVTICYAPGINMSPRSDAEKALFEKIKYDFNAFRSGTLSHVKYKIGDKYYDIPELFYYYNQIAFDGRPGENTMTSIFQDILDYKPIKEYRDYENALDMEGVIDVDDYTLSKETALRQNPWSSNMHNIYYEDPDTGLLAFWTKIGNVRGDDEGQIRLINGYNPSFMNYNVETKNYINVSADRISYDLVLSDNEKVIIEINKGKVTKITRQDKSELIIPDKAKPFFENPPANYLIQPNGSKQLVFNTNKIRQGIENIIKCH